MYIYKVQSSESIKGIFREKFPSPEHCPPPPIQEGTTLSVCLWTPPWGMFHCFEAEEKVGNRVRWGRACGQPVSRRDQPAELSGLLIPPAAGGDASLPPGPPLRAEPGKWMLWLFSPFFTACLGLPSTSSHQKHFLSPSRLPGTVTVSLNRMQM